jgi:hypothetical protein
MLYVIAALALAAVEDVDASATKDAGQIYTDGKGHYLTYAGADEAVVFYGDGRTFYQLRYQGWQYDRNDGTFNVGLLDPRYVGKADVPVTVVRNADGQVTVTCGKRVTAMTEVKGDKARAILTSAAYKRPPHAFWSYALARDDHGVYYYVDQGRYDDNSSVFHVYVGQRGNMKRLKLTNIVHDSGGDIFTTAAGDLRLVLNKDSAEWVKGENHATLELLPTEDNIATIYNDLGAYRNLRLGMPCDDL